MRVRWAAAAEQDRADIFDYIARDNPRAALAMDELFSDAAAGLADWPRKGPPGRVPGTRELLIHPRYYLIYEVDDAEGVVSIVGILHTARRWPPMSTA